MQIKKRKFLIGTLLSVTSIGVVGSVIGTYAWYTYNTKDTLVYHGIAAASNENLQFRLAGTEEWKTVISSKELTDYAESKGFAGSALEPVSFNTAQKKNEKLQPFIGKYDAWDSIAPTDESETKPYYLQVKLEFKCQTVDEEPEAVIRDIYLSKLNIKATSEGKNITPAIRMHFNDGTAVTDNKTLVAPARSAGSMHLYGSYDMDGDGLIDHGRLREGETHLYEKAEGEGTIDVPYGDTVNQPDEAWFGKSDILATFDSENYAIGGRKLLTTSTSTVSFNSVTMTIWLDGWDAACINANAKCEFDIDLQFHSAVVPE